MVDTRVNWPAVRPALGVICHGYGAMVLAWSIPGWWGYGLVAAGCLAALAGLWYLIRLARRGLLTKSAPPLQVPPRPLAARLAEDLMFGYVEYHHRLTVAERNALGVLQGAMHRIQAEDQEAPHA